MFDGMPDQFYQFLAAARGATATAAAAAASLPLPLSFSLHHHHHHHHASFPTYPPPPPRQASFDSPPFPLSPPPPPPPHHHLLHHTQLPLQLLQQAASHIKHEDKEETTVDVAPSGLEPMDPWSHDEVLVLLRIRSNMDNNWFPADFTWENVSRKLAEVGFKRSPDECKEKFEEETGIFNTSIITNCSSKNIINNYRLFGELEELCNNNADHHHQSPPSNPDQGDNHDHHETLLTQMNEIPKNTENEGHEQVVEEKEKEEQEQDKIIIGQDQRIGDDDKEVGREQSVDDSEKTEENTKGVSMRKRKRQNKFEMFKGFCESIVNNMMAQQEQLHCKILHDMVKRDEDKIAKEEAWKKQEIERIRNEMEVRALDLAIAGDRQSKILDMLKIFMSSNSFQVGDAIENLIKVSNTSSNSSVLSQPTSSCTTHDQNPSSLMIPNMPTSSSNENLASQSPNRVENSKLALPISSSQNPNPIITIENDTFRLVSVPTHKSSGSDHTSTDAANHITYRLGSPEKQPKAKSHLGNHVKDDTGRRWPRDEVLALINIRCSLFNNNNGDHHSHHDSSESSAKGPLWERISQKMMELGYRRSAKRCKEKWENINKYFRKTKDLNKKRSIDSRTCPYFHQLSHLYSQGAVVRTTDPPTDHPALPENTPVPLPGVQGGSSTSTNSNGATTTMHACVGNEGVVQVPAFDFEF